MSIIRAAGIPLMRTVKAPITIVSGGPTHVAMSPTRAAGRPPMSTVTAPGGKIGLRPDRATLANMAPEYGATAALFPVDDQTLRYLRETGRGREAEVAERYSKEQGLFRTGNDDPPAFDEVVELDLSAVEPSLAGPRRPQDRVALPAVPRHPPQRLGPRDDGRRGVDAEDGGRMRPAQTDGSGGAPRLSVWPRLASAL